MPQDAGYYDDEAAPSQAESGSVATAPDKDEKAVPENKLALVSNSFFKETPKPGDREMVEVVNVYEGETSIKCVYDDKEEEKAEEEPGMEAGAAPMGAEDEMMA